MLGKKQIWVIFLFEFRMSHNAAERTRNINHASGPGTAKERTGQWWFKVCKGDESLILEDEEHGDCLSEADNDKQSNDQSWSSYNLYERLLKNPVSTILWFLGIWSKLERQKSSRSGSLLSWLKKKNHCFEVVFSYSIGFPCGSAGKESACNAGDLGLIGGLGRPPGEGYPP